MKHTTPVSHTATGCISTDSSLLDPALLNVVPPLRFAIVEEGVFRGAYPTLRNFPFLRTLGLRTIVSLVPEEPTYDLVSFAAAEGITIQHIRVERYKDDTQLLPTDVGKALHFLISVDMHPLYIHCLDGRHTVGLIVMGLRKLQQWDVNCSHLEYQRFTRSVQDEMAFIADYSGPVVVPECVPHWLWDGSWLDSSGTPKRLLTGIRLKFPSVVGSGKAAPVQPEAPGKDITFPLYTALTKADGAAYIDVESVAPIQPVALGNGNRCAVVAKQARRSAAADLRFLSLRASSETVLGPQQWAETREIALSPGVTQCLCAGTSFGSSSNHTTTTGDSVVLARPSPQQANPLVTLPVLPEADENSGFVQVSPQVTLQVAPFASTHQFSGNSTPHVSVKKTMSRQQWQLHFVGPDGTDSVAPAESAMGVKKSRRRRSL
ncbi:putative Tyrosine phosphatase family [Trypanosoma vivax]|uniref:Putative tyrosine phospatase-like protein n=1 Tax=Trypanosoma vivax (strain Y486) TaxID=1055687 RepID=G0U2K5_TRYVY|nr:putative tyrosine phospatase-like protein [Trypanosoma vivax]KAH8604095.1 putative Tyrosine phosphatase family [Trypanosoma vivax]CCC50508.1 putative tyrosine phospatase-like protein [Trypanosoma vivax Y486]